VPYWGKYVYHDNNRDINIKLVQMRAIIDWYFTAFPPIMHDLHEALPLLYTYTGGPPQNPNLDPILFAELPWFGNWEMAQMTKWGMPGVYTHAFMDGWSPGYLGSVAYNHNGLMKMYETQSGRDLDSAAMARARGRPGPRQANAAARGGGGGGAASAAALVGCPRAAAAGRIASGIAAFPSASTTWPPSRVVQHQLHADRRALGAAAGEHVPAGRCSRTSTSRRATASEAGAKQAPYAFVIPVQRDMTRVAEIVNAAARAAHRSGVAT
jgi:hypothetical protein